MTISRKLLTEKEKETQIRKPADTSEPLYGTVDNIANLLTGEQIDALLTRDPACAEWCPDCADRLSCEQAWSRWDADELCQEIQRVDLETSIDASLTDDTLEINLSDEEIAVRCEIISPREGVPPQIREFLRDLEKLVKKTEQQLRAATAKKRS